MVRSCTGMSCAVELAKRLLWRWHGQCAPLAASCHHVRKRFSKGKGQSGVRTQNLHHLSLSLSPSLLLFLSLSRFLSLSLISLSPPLCLPLSLSIYTPCHTKCSSRNS